MPRMKTTLILLVGVLTGFILGVLTGLLRPGIVSYRAGGGQFVAFHRDNPVSGLEPLLYCFVLEELHRNDTNRAADRLESILDLAVQGAMERRPLLTEDGRSTLDKVLTRVAHYRDRFPRTNFMALTNQSGDSPWFRGVMQTNAMQQRRIDDFLKQFGTALPRN